MIAGPDKILVKYNVKADKLKKIEGKSIFILFLNGVGT